MSANWQTIETAIYTWAVAQSGLAAANVVWAAQTEDALRPTGQHVSLKLDTGSPLGTSPAREHDFDEDAENGEEITHTHSDVLSGVLSLQVIGGETNGNSSARAIASQLQRSLVLSTVRAAFRVAGFSVLKRGTLQHLPEIRDADFEPRSVFEVSVLVADSVTEKTGYISTVELIDELTP